MPQLQLPMFPEGVTHITNELAFKKEGEMVTYFNGHMPVFVHDADDIQTFRMITSQFCVNGNAKLIEISRAFGIPLISVKRGVKRYREEGPAGFYAQRKKRGPTVLTPDVLFQVQQEFDKCPSIRKVAEAFEINYETLKKAVSDGRIKKKHKRSKSQAVRQSCEQAPRVSAA